MCMFIHFKKSKIHYEKYGTFGDIIVILPGWGETKNTFQYIINFFQNDHIIYIIDYPGFGDSPSISVELTVYDYALLVKKILEKERIVEPIVIAHSFGGRICAILQGYYHINFSKIVLMDVAGIKHRKKLLPFFKEKLYKFLKKIVTFFHCHKLKEKLFSFFASSDYQNIPSYMRKTFQNIVLEDLTKYYQLIQADTLILWGECDQDTPLKDAYLLHRIIKNSGLIVYKNSSHFSYLENIEATNLILLEFIRNKNMDDD